MAASGKAMASRIGQVWWAIAAGFLVAAAGTMQPVLPTGAAGAPACQRAGLDAEHALNLPPGLLLAIGVVESGRRDPMTGRVAAWPWTITANGVGQAFESQAEAAAATRALQARGVTSIDVGCFQINLHHHPAAFTDLDEAFDPQANAAYAARFLSALRTRTGSWENAVAAYHSATPELGGPYRDRVLASLTGGDALSAAAPPNVERVLVWTPTPATNRMQVWTPDAPGLAPGVISFGPAPAGPPLPVTMINSELRR
jgi:hypothetical protein